MRKKRIAQYCCAALVAAGIGLNIQNAVTDYGMNGNTLSLAATGETLGWCSYAALSNIYTYTYSNGYEVEKEGRIEQCCGKAGLWRMVFFHFSNGQEQYLRGTQLTYQRWRSTMYTQVIINPNGTRTYRHYRLKTCKEFPGAEESDCPYLDGTEIEWID
jgi:hypothetical protein